MSRPTREHNRAAVTAHLTAGSAKALLCSDLEHDKDDLRGWGAAANVRPSGSPRGTLVKVAHHGSPNGQDPRIWADMLDPAPVAVVTHFHGGAVHLPPHDQIGVLVDRTAALFSTSRTRVAAGDAWGRTPSGRAARGPAEFETQAPGWGQVRARADMAVGDPWRVGLFDDAHQIHP